MIIRKMDATFGKLRRSSLELGEGLNIIYGDNESGKSTWCGFIRAMLYGINTREQSKIGFIADKERYRPYTGESMHGRMEVLWQGSNLAIERTAGRSGIFGNAVVTDLKTGLNVNGIDVPGESMFGIKKEVFRRSAFIGQSLLKVDTDKEGELERRIVSMAGSGQEESSYSSAVQRLKSWKHRRRYNNRGIAPALEDEIYNIKTALNSLRGDGAALTAKQSRLNLLRNMEKEYVRQEEIWKGIRAWEKINLNRDAQAGLEQAERELKQAIENAKIGEVLPDEKMCDNLRHLYQKYMEGEKNYSICLETARKSEIELASEREKLSSFSLFVKDENCNAGQDAEKVREMLKELKKPGFGLPFAIFSLAGILFGAAAFFATKLVEMDPVLGCITGAVLAVSGITAGIIAGCGKNGKKKKLRDEIDAILKLYGAETAEDIESKGGKYMYAKQLFEGCVKQTELAQEELEKAKKERDRFRELLIADAVKIDTGADVDSIPELIETMTEKLNCVKEAHAAYKTAAVRFEAVQKGQSVDGAVGETVAPVTKSPEYSEEELKEKLIDVRGELRQLELDSSAIKARMNHVGNPGDLQEQLRQAKEKLEEVDSDTRAIELAMAELAEANGEIQRRFAPDLEKKAGEIFERLTDGHFKIVEILNPQLEMAVREESAAESRQVLELSAGTADELYLAMRLALSDMLTENESVPVILDDALVNFDDRRMENTLNYLAELAKEKQIIVFSCQKREAEWAKDRDDVKVQRIS